MEYKVNHPISVDQFIDLLARSTLAERRPIDDIACMSGMLEHGDLLVTAWQDDVLVGLARCITDFHYCCYISELAVDEAYQQQGIGRALQQQVKSQLGPRCKVLLIAAPAAKDYYPKLGYQANDRCWQLNADDLIES